MFKKPRLLVLLILGLFSSTSGFVYAADFNIIPANANFGLKQEFSVDLKINTSGSSINAAQAKIIFPSDSLEVKNISKEGSVFNFWLQEPIFDNGSGEIKFTAGTSSGVSGSTIQVLRINFITKNSGSVKLSLTEGAITSSDGTGENILVNSNGASFTVSETVYSPTATNTENVVIPPPVQITRKPAISAVLPVQPGLVNSLYTDQSKWYNLIGQFTVSWQLPLDISGVSTALNSNPNFEATPRSEGLFSSKTFPAILKDGMYYLHVRFQNNNGWGKTAHFQIAIDTQPPLPLKIDVKSGLSSENPSPTLIFDTGDSLSGISQYSIRIGSEEPVYVSAPEYQIPPHQPGKYIIKVSAIDQAGNSTENSIEVEILPIERPVINSITEKVIRDTNNFFYTQGTAIPDSTVMVTILHEDKSIISHSGVKSDSRGVWYFDLNNDLSAGRYLVIAKTVDSRGASSLPTDVRMFQVKDKPIISLGGLDITFKNLAWALGIALIGLGLYYWRRITIHMAKMQLMTTVVSGDLRNSVVQMRNQLDNIDSISKKDTSAESKNTEYVYSYQKIREGLDKVEKYLTKEIENLD